MLAFAAARKANVRPGPDLAREQALFAGVGVASAGIYGFALGATFNFVVSVFHKRQIRQGLLGRPIFQSPLETHFGWLGLVTILAGFLVYALAVWQNLTAPGSMAPWFAPAVSAVLVLTGLNLVTSWLLIIGLAELSQRETRAVADLGEVAVLAEAKARKVDVVAPVVS